MKMSRLSLVPATLALALVAPFAHADQATKDAKIKELLHVLKVDQVGQQIIEGATSQTTAIGHREFGTTETPEQQKQVAELHDKVVATVTPAVEWKALEPEFLAAYNAAYTEPEIDGILAFYKSPAGQALLTKGPEVGQKSSQIVQAHMSTVQPQLRQIVQDFAKSNQPKESAPAAAPGTLQPRTAPSLSNPPATTPAPQK